MKRIVIVIAAALLASVNAFAQPGIIAGLTSSTTSVKDVEAVKSINTYHAGVTFKANLGLGFAIQPSLIYQVKGSNLGDIGKDTKAEDFQLKTGFVEVPVQLQWGPDLLAFRPYLFAEPFIGYAVSSDDKILGSGESGAFKTWAQNAKTKIEYGIGPSTISRRRTNASSSSSISSFPPSISATSASSSPRPPVRTASPRPRSRTSPARCPKVSRISRASRFPSPSSSDDGKEGGHLLLGQLHHRSDIQRGSA